MLVMQTGNYGTTEQYHGKNKPEFPTIRGDGMVDWEKENLPPNRTIACVLIPSPDESYEIVPEDEKKGEKPLGLRSKCLCLREWNDSNHTPVWDPQLVYARPILKKKIGPPEGYELVPDDEKRGAKRVGMMYMSQKDGIWHPAMPGEPFTSSFDYARPIKKESGLTAHQEKIRDKSKELVELLDLPAESIILMNRRERDE